MKRSYSLVVPLLVVLGLAVLVFSTKKTSVIDACNVRGMTGDYEENADTAFSEGERISVPSYITDNENLKNVLGNSSSDNKWIEIILSQQEIKAWDGDKLFLDSKVSTGLPWFPTPTGEFRIWAKLRYTRMAGGVGALAYDLPNVPFTMFFSNNQVPTWKGYSLHGTYWHNDFGRQHSHGCVNLPTPVAEKIYYWANPVMPSGASSTFATADNPGTKVLIHN